MTTVRNENETESSQDANGSLSHGRYPEGLLEWAGHRAGGVRRLFYDTYGRPSGRLIETPLLGRLREWADAVAAGKPAPRIVLLLGGPGNGKTEAVEVAIRQLEASLALDGEIVAALAPQFNPTDGSTVPRLVTVRLAELGSARPLDISLVQDASVRDPGRPGLTAAELLVEDLDHHSSPGTRTVYLACINRGVLDDALIAARDRGQHGVRALLESIVRAVGVGLAAPSCWPLESFPEVAIWPMDVESLLTSVESDGVDSPALQALRLATDIERWPTFGSCAAGERCPFCMSRELLAAEPHRGSLLAILRYYELTTGKRWSFRDLFSLFSFILAGSPQNSGGSAESPCQWATQLLEMTQAASSRSESLRLAAPYLLVAAQYQHALFGVWPKFRRGGIRRLLRELQLDEDATLLGLHYFLTGIPSRSVPRTLQAELSVLCASLDPALASPDQEVDVSAKSRIGLRDLDTRFSNSVREGYESIRRYHCLSTNELDLLRRLAEADDKIGSPEVRRRKPASAAKLQMLVRNFACRLVRRSLGCRSALVRDAALVRDFARLINGDAKLFYQAAKHVEGLLNEGDKFTITVNSTFGEPLPPETRRVVLETQKQKVRPATPRNVSRPPSDLRFLTVGANTATQPIPLTYELFRSVRELQDGLAIASLPRPVIAALDAVRARLAGRVVRDEEQLDGAEIRIGIRKERIAREMGQFIVRSEDE